MSHGLFDLIKNIVLVVFGYQFNANNKSTSNKEEINEKEK
jgi:hypothetical protein